MPRTWVAWLNRALNEEQLEGIRTCVQRGRPLGLEDWVRRTAKRKEKKEKKKGDSHQI